MSEHDAVSRRARLVLAKFAGMYVANQIRCLARRNSRGDRTRGKPATNLIRHYKAVKSDQPEDLVFQSVRTGAPMRDNNILSRHIKPAARKLGLPWINWCCLRTSHATWMVEAGDNPKDVQGQMRHSRISTTMDIYAQFVPESQRRALAKMSAMVEAR